MTASTPLQKLSCRKPIVKSHPANQAAPRDECCVIRILLSAMGCFLKDNEDSLTEAPATCLDLAHRVR